MDRYDRQERVKQIGTAGQGRISQATVLIVGVGGLGSYAAATLARAGVKKLILVDPDTVSLTNLQRQALFTERDCQEHRFKVAAVKDHLQAINSSVEVAAIPAPLTADLVVDNHFDLCLDCLDNYRGRALLNELAIKHHFDYVFASCAGNYGNVMAISPQEHPCLTCLFPDIKQLMNTDCDVIGVNAALLPLVAGMQSSIALHYLVDQSTVDFDHLITYDNWSMTANRFKVSKQVTCPACQRHRQISTDEGGSQLTMLCGADAYYIRLTREVKLSNWASYLDSLGALTTSNPLFIQFKWSNRPVSLFKNGKLVMYDLADRATAEGQLNSIIKLANKIREGASNDSSRYFNN